MISDVEEQMKTKDITRYVKPYEVRSGKDFRLKDFDPADTAGLGAESKPKAQELLQKGVERLAELQGKLYAQDSRALLLIFQAMDAAGKDGTIKHVMSGVNPQGCQVYSFKAPSQQDLDHDYLWRTTRCMPERGRIGIFNRSYYEEVLVVRVHPELLEAEKLPREFLGKHIWKQRYADIRNFENYATNNGTVIRKFFLHLSKEEQRKRFLQRLDTPEKNWKFSSADVRERGYWDNYQQAYEEMIQHTATKSAPWYVIPADNKWFARLVVAGAVVDALEELKLHYPVVDEAKKKELKQAEAALRGEKKK